MTLRSTAHATKGAIIFGAASSYDEANNRLGIGTLTPAAKVHALATTEQLRLGYDDSNYLSCTVSSAGQTTFNGSLGQYVFLTPVASTATLGAELVSNNSFATDLASWTAGAGWSWSSGGALHTAGNTATLETTVAVTSGQTYEIIITISNRTAGSISVAIGAASVIESGTTTAFTASFDTGVVAVASGSVALIITPTSDFNGRVDDVSVRQVTLISAPALMRITESGSSSFEMRVSRVLESMSCGLASHRSHVSGIYNTSYGFSAARDILTGEGNSSFGRGACYALTTGDNNSAFGRSAAVALTTGGGNCMFGFNSGRGITTTSNNITIGSDAGRYLANGSTALSTPSNSVFVGALTKASANNITAENVFGYNATGIGNNTTVIGASTNVKTQIFGDIVFDKTVTSSGTTGAQTIDKTVGSVNFAAGATSLVVTNSRVTASSIIVATVATNDATMKSVSAVSASGSFTLTANAAATAETRVNFIVIN